VSDTCTCRAATAAGATNAASTNHAMSITDGDATTDGTLDASPSRGAPWHCVKACGWPSPRGPSSFFPGPSPGFGGHAVDKCQLSMIMSLGNA